MKKYIYYRNCKKKFGKLLTSITLILLFGITARGQLIGSLSGVLEADRYTIIGEVWVEAGNSLIIEPGTELYVENGSKFEVNGCLIAEGTETDSIIFTVSDTSQSWLGIHFMSSPDTSRLRYCVLEYGSIWEIPFNCGGAIYCYGSELIIKDCTIRNSWAEAGGGMFFWHANPTVENCIISDNSSEVGGGIGFGQSNPTIKDCIISNNATTLNGGGIWCNDESYPIIENCTISGNSSDADGGGIYCDDSSPAIINCTIRDNFSADCGGGLYSNNSSGIDLIINNCDITGNISADDGGGIYCWNSTLTIENSLVSENSSEGSGGGIYNYGFDNSSSIENCTISGNRAEFDGGGIHCRQTGILNTIIEGNSGNGGIYSFGSTYFPVTYNDFYNNEGGSFEGYIPDGLGDIVTVNANGDSCDEFYNLFMDPLFYSTSGVSAFNLTENSPCIDAGDPAGTFDPDSTIADMGAYYFHHTVGVDEIVTLEIPAKFDFYNPHPNPFNQRTALDFTLPSEAQVSLSVFDITGREIAKLVDGYKSAGHHQIEFNASQHPSGVYFARLQAGDLMQTGKMLLIK